MNAKMSSKECSKLHTGHRKRLRFRFRQEGLKIFNEHQILEYLLSFVIPRKDTNELAHKLINKFGSLNNVVSVPYNVLSTFNGLGEVSATFLNTLPQIIEYFCYMQNKGHGAIRSTNDALVMLKPLFKKIGNEKFVIVLLDNNDKILHYNVSDLGYQDSIDVNIEEARNLIKSYNAKKAVIAHNHPNGKVFPSRKDMDVTKTLYSMFRFLGVELVDHCIITGDGEHFSFRSACLIEEYQKDLDFYFGDTIKRVCDNR